MAKLDSLKDIVKFNSSFKTAVNLYLSLNKPEKVLGYIPTKSSVNFLGDCPIARFAYRVSAQKSNGIFIYFAEIKWTQKKQTHRLRGQTNGYQWGEGRKEGQYRGLRDTKQTTII